jgi:HK97 family phage portal protein
MNLRQRLEAAWRAFKLGTALDWSTTAFGVSPEEWAPEEYGQYIATSNAIYTCATLRAQMLASLPLVLYKLKKGNRATVDSGRAYELLQKVNPHWTLKRLLQMTELSLCLWGSAFWFLERGASGKQPPKEIWWGRPDRVTVFPHETEYISHFTYRAGNGQEIVFRPSEVIWFRYPNPLDEYSGLSPIAAARLAADVASAAMKSNRNLFVNGLQIGGVVVPKQGQILTEKQAQEIEEALARRFRGVDKAHRWGVFRFEAEMKPLGVTPRDADFIRGLQWSLEEVARAFKVPLDLVGGQRTYENVEAAHRAIWTHCLLPEADFIASELTEQLLPMFPGEADLAEFDTSDIEVLHEGETAAWERAAGQIDRGVITINEWRQERGLDPVPWGDVWWGSAALVPISSAERPAQPSPSQSPPVAEETPRGFRAWEWGSPEHERRWGRFVRGVGRHEQRFTQVVQTLFKRQEESVLAKLRGPRGKRALPPEEEPFDKADWIARFREEVKPIIADIVKDMGEEELEELGFKGQFNVGSPSVIHFIEQRAQRFAEAVNETTWNRLKETLKEGIEAGEGIPELAKRVENVMGDRIRSTPETIARTEVVGASNGGILEAFRQSGIVVGKTWLAALDERTRPSHVAAHGQTVDLEDDFVVGAGKGPAPGQIGLPEEDINCRCTLVAVIG